MTHKIRVLSEEDIRRALDMHTAIDAVSNAFSQLSNGALSMPMRMVTDFDDTMLFYKPAASKNEDIISVKILTQTSSNRGRGLAVIQGVIILTNYNDGRFLALMDGTYITALRTGAASGLATRLLSREDAKVAAIFGAGAQGRTQLSAICAVRKLREIFIFDINKKAIQDFIDEMQPQCSAALIPAHSLETLREVDIICTATDSTQPLFGLSNSKRGVHINAIGSFKPSMIEISGDVMAHASVYVDHKESAMAESGDLIHLLQSGLISASHIGEIGELINKKVTGRTDNEQITLFKSVGVAVQDLAMAHAVYRNAVRNDIGQILYL